MTNAERVSVLTEVYERTGSEVSALYLAIDRVMTLSLLVIAGGVAVGEGAAAALLIPVGIGLVSLYLLDLLRQMMTVIGYRRFLEEEVNELEAGERAGVKDFIWETWVSAMLIHHSRSRRLLQALYAAVVIGSSVVSIRAGITYHGDFDSAVQAGVVLFWVLTWIAAVVAVLENSWAAEQSRLWAHYATDSLGDVSVPQEFKAWQQKHAGWLGLVPKRGTTELYDHFIRRFGRAKRRDNGDIGTPVEAVFGAVDTRPAEATGASTRRRRRNRNGC